MEIARMTQVLMTMLLLTTGVAVPSGATSRNGTEPLAVISLYNPTGWAGPLVVEVPTGRIAAPGLVDWRQVRLQLGHRTIPFAVRAGCAHWRARPMAPVSSPRAEDLLVFACAVPPGEWIRVQVLQESSLVCKHTNHLSRKNGRATITYADVKAVIDEAAGLLRELSYQEESLLAGPLSVQIAELSKATPYELVGAFDPGYAYPEDQGAPRVWGERRRW